MSVSDQTIVLLPCPFCGGDASDYCTPTWEYWVYCEPCQIKFVRMSRAIAANAWNCRTPITETDMEKATAQ